MKRLAVVLATCGAVVAAGCASTCASEGPLPEPPAGMVVVPGGEFSMGTDDGMRFEGPAHRVRVSSFFLAEHEVTVAEFAEFVRDTGYVTEAEELGWAAVFDLEARGWKPVEGASWRHPEGPSTSVDDRQDHPAVHVSHADAEAYAAWAGGRLPTEAEREYAARGGLDGARYPWGDELTPGGDHRANVWQGRFPSHNSGDDGFAMTAPVDSFPPNGYGLYGMAGNVWEWTADWFAPYPDTKRVRRDPTGPETGSEKVIRGGSWMCAENYCTGYRVAARQANEPDAALANLGFRLARDP